jgi:hypothetical protein
MTARELIARLNQLPNPDLPVVVDGRGYEEGLFVVVGSLSEQLLFQQPAEPARGRGPGTTYGISPYDYPSKAATPVIRLEAA